MRCVVWWGIVVKSGVEKGGKWGLVEDRWRGVGGCGGMGGVWGEEWGRVGNEDGRWGGSVS